MTITLDPAAPRDAEGRLLTRTDEIDVAGTSDAAEGAGIRVLGAGRRRRRSRRWSARAAPSTSPCPRPTPGTTGGSRSRARTGRWRARRPSWRVRDAVPPEIALDAPPPAATANGWLELAGSAGDAVSVAVNGAAARLDGGRFDAAPTLVPGTNAIEIVATDAAGNVAVKRVETVYDIDPPEITAATVGRPEGADGPIEIVVRGARRLGAAAGGAVRR